MRSRGLISTAIRSRHGASAHRRVVCCLLALLCVMLPSLAFTQHQHGQPDRHSSGPPPRSAPPSRPSYPQSNRPAQQPRYPQKPSYAQPQSRPAYPPQRNLPQQNGPQRNAPQQNFPQQTGPYYGQGQRPGQQPAYVPPPRYTPPSQFRNGGSPTPYTRAPQGHLGDWLQQHQGQSLQDQTRAFQREPGFNRLPQQQQQRLVQRLQDLNHMPAQQRQRTLQRMENMERLPPQQRDQVRSSAQQMGQLPQDRQQVVRRAFRDLRAIPPGLRSSELNSPRYSGQFSPEEHTILNNLLKVEPYQAPPPPPR